jgi:hypothetical protein
VHCINVSTATAQYNITTTNVAACFGAGVQVATSQNTYTWVVFKPGSSPQTNVGTTANVVVTASGNYTVQVNPGSCNTGAFIVSVTLLQNPVVTISGNTVICSGQSAILTASGAQTYTWNIGANSPSILVSPLVNTTYSVIGMNASGCTAMAVKAVVVLAAPQLTITPASQTVCLGTSANLQAGGANSYLWNNSATTATINVLPSATTTYTVAGTGSNGCVGYQTAVVTVDPNCSDVWPGDANSDGVVSTLDVIEIGLHTNATGPARNSVSIQWQSFFCNNWSGTVSTGKNKCHADCNGNGTINAGDVGAITSNLNNTHTFRVGGSSGNSVIRIVPPAHIVAGEYVKADIMLAESANPLSDVYGITFDVIFDPSLIQQDEAYLAFPSSFLSDNNTNIEFQKLLFNDGKIAAAIVRTDGANVNGFGKVAEFWFKLKSDLPDGTVIDLDLNNTSVSDNSGNNEPLPASGDAVTVNDWVSVGTNNLAERVQMFPNPSTGKVVLAAGGNSKVGYHISDLTGRLVQDGSFSASIILDLGSLESGVYFVKLTEGKATATKKIVLEK